MTEEKLINSYKNLTNNAELLEHFLIDCLKDTYPNNNSLLDNLLNNKKAFQQSIWSCIEHYPTIQTYIVLSKDVTFKKYVEGVILDIDKPTSFNSNQLFPAKLLLF